ncbi:MAG: arylsulfatase [Novosphingobium sp.]|nr:arylsulfatase [Novosphingobium sp.]
MTIRRLLLAATALGLVTMPVAPALAQAAPPAAPAQAQAQAQAQVPAQQRPNMLVWMLDDVGFAQLSSFGGLIETPNIDRVAAMGLRYSNYHTAPICSASRAAILTGRNPHTVHMGGHAAAELPYPGYDSRIPASAGTLAANLKAAGYATFALGKWDHLPSEEMGPAGPFRFWPAGQGFDRFYGFLAADTDNFNPVLVRDTSPVARPEDGAYHLNHDLADQAIAMIGSRASRDPAPPFFLYFATGTAHAPHHAPADWIARYKGRFDGGWDKARAAILARQIAAGLMPKGTKLAPRPEGMPAWDSLSPDAQRLYARQMEVFAASLGYADAQFGRVLDALEASGELDNTVVVVTSDNGASAEGAPDGTHNESLFVNAKYPSVAENLPFLESWGGPRTYPHYAMGWAVAGNTPLRNYKQTAHQGGTRVPLVMAWPRGIAARGEVRGQFVDVADIAPTLLDLARVPLAATINNVRQQPMDGQSFAPTLSDPAAPSPSQAQYFEMYGNKSLWSGGWSIVTSHRMKTWDMTLATPPNEPWELYHTDKDPGQTVNLAARYPAKVEELARLFDEQARAFNVYPISNMSEARPYNANRLREEMARRGGKWRFPVPVSRIAERAGPPVTALPFRVRAKLDLKGGASGPVLALGGKLGGMALFLDQGVPVFMVRDLAGQPVRFAASAPLPGGATELELDLDRKPGAGLEPVPVTVTLRANGQQLASSAAQVSIAPAFGVAETLDIGVDWGSAVADSYQAGVPFPGWIGPVEIDFNRP